MRVAIALFAFLGCAATPRADRTTAVADTPLVELGDAQVEAIAGMALACVEQEYPNKIAHVMASDADARPPRELTPAFYGCFDWHSAVHGHWLLARVARLHPSTKAAALARQVLARHLTAERIAGELAYVGREDRSGFERPYGLAWLLALAAELHAWDDADARAWAKELAPLERLARDRMLEWLPKLTHPIRIGEHAQTAFAMGLAIDWARSTGDDEALAVLVERAKAFHGSDRGCDLAFEPSGHDFLSPCLGAADLMARVLPPAEYGPWLSRALPAVRTDGASFLHPVAPTDRTDGKLVHLDGLSLSRAWMLDRIARGLPSDDPRRASLRVSAREHADAGLAALAGQGYEGAHWLGTFAMMLAGDPS